MSLWTFPGGLRLPGHKDASTREPIARAAIPPRLVIPLQQHIGELGKPLVRAGDTVLKGEIIGRAPGYVSAPVHASTSGRVVAIEDRPVPHPSGLSARCVVIEPDGRDAWTTLPDPIEDFRDTDPAILRQRLRDCGIVGLGGAAFPTAVKLNTIAGGPVEELVLNGAECEPYITCDDMLMRERAAEVLAGLKIMRHMLQARRCLIGIEDNKPRARAALDEALAADPEEGIEIVAVPTRYPAGGEKQLVYTLTGKEVPSDGLPLEVGVVCQNVATAVAAHRAVSRGEPMVSRIVTIAGGAIDNPGNWEVLIGTSFAELIRQAGGYRDDVSRLLMGGPMMGFALSHDEVPVVKATNCILAGTAREFPEPAAAMPCIRCGACSDACPVTLLPQQMYWHAKARDFDRAQDYDLFDCIECGVCSYVCPSHIPLVQYFRFAKSEIWAAEKERRKADLARDRFEFRQERLEREKAEKEARRREKKQALKRARGGDDSEKQAAIQAALERAQKKQADQEPVTDHGNDNGKQED